MDKHRAVDLQSRQGGLDFRYPRRRAESMANKPNARRKGKTGELEFAAEINQRLGSKFLERNLEQVRNGGHDLIVANGNARNEIGKRLDQLAFEIKRRKNIKASDLKVWWKQAVTQSQRINKWPVLCYRQDRNEWNCLFPLSKDLEPSNLKHCVNMGIDLFVELIKNPNLSHVRF